MQQPVEQVFAGFAAHGKTARCISARCQTSLDGRADCDVFALNSLALLDTGEIAMSRVFGNIFEIEIEDDLGLCHAARNHEVCVHGRRINIHHEVRVEPVVKRPSTAGKRTPLKTETIAEFDLVFGIIENAIEALVQMRHVISAVEIIIDKHLPITVERVMAPFEPVKLIQIDLKIAQAGYGSVYPAESRNDPTFPNGDFERHKSHRFSIKITDASQIRRALQVSF